MELKSKLLKSGVHQSSGITLEFNKSDKDKFKNLSNSSFTNSN